MKNNLINHVIFVVDRSGSMAHLTTTVPKVLQDNLDFLRRQDQLTGQETRVSLYTFSSNTTEEIFDRSLDKAVIPDYYVAGQTALIDATMTAINDHLTISTTKGDHAFLLYVLTDGEENNSRRYTETDLRSIISRLPNNWTLVVQVPDHQGWRNAQDVGFPRGNIEIWNATSKQGLEEATRSTQRAFTNYYQQRSVGIKGVSNFYSPDLSAVTKTQVRRRATALRSSQFKKYPVRGTYEIRDFVERATGKPYISGSAFYELIKPETVQPYKEVLIINKKTQEAYREGARHILGLPSYELKVSPGDHGDWEVYIQSTSYNRKVFSGNVVVVK